MMKRFPLHLMALLTLCGTMAMTGVAHAQGEDRADADRREQREARRDKARSDGPRGARQDARQRMVRQLFEGIELSEEQRQEVRDVMQKHREGVQKWREDHEQEIKKLRERMREARREQDREAAVAAFEELLKLSEDRPKPENLLDDIRGELNDDQIKAFNENVEEIKEKARQRMEERRDKAEENRGERKERRGDRGDRGERGDRAERRDRDRD